MIDTKNYTMVLSSPKLLLFYPELEHSFRSIVVFMREALKTAKNLEDLRSGLEKFVRNIGPFCCYFVDPHYDFCKIPVGEVGQHVHFMLDLESPVRIQ